MTEVKGVALPKAASSSVEHKINGAEFKVTRVRPAQSVNQVPIATIIVANPADTKSVLYGDVFLNGFTNEQAGSILGNKYTGDIEVMQSIPLLDEQGVPITTKKTHEPVVSRRVRLAGTPTLTERAQNFTKSLIPA